jgi:hypothetical protein
MLTTDQRKCFKEGMRLLLNNTKSKSQALDLNFCGLKTVYKITANN